MIPVALNLFSAVCAALTLALLARSVTLLPHDRTHEQRVRERSAFSFLSVRSAWVPPVLAAIVCGLQLTFWESATTASGNMINLLLFAYVIRCVLEFRVDERESWLTRASLVFAAGMANNWEMVGFFPAFLLTLVWVRGKSFFDLSFLSRMFVCGLVGLSLYLLLPLVQSLADIGQLPFWTTLKANLAAQKTTLWLLYRNGRQGLALMALTSVLPVLIIGIRWASFSGDTSRLGVNLGTWMFHIVHGLFLLACIWMALDPPFSPRNKGYGLPFLTLYYLAALSVGYFSGYLLLVFGAKPAKFHRAATSVPLVNNSAIGLVWVLLFLAAAALVYRNLSQIRTTNGPMLRQFTSAMAANVPAEKTIVFSDDPRRLELLQSAMTQDGTAKECVFVDTGSLSRLDYHRFLKRRYPQRWPWDPKKGQEQRIQDTELIQAIAQLGQSNSLYYLHPSFGYYFEVLFPEPHGLIYQLKFYPSNALMAPPLTDGLINENEAFWNKTEEENLRPLLTSLQAASQRTGLAELLMARAHLHYETNRTAALLSGFYSRALNFWGVELQKNGRWTNAAARFELAKTVNPDNVVAQMNLVCNECVRAGRKAPDQLPPAVSEALGRYSNWDQMVGENGPFDDPTFCYEQGRAFVRGQNYRQAAQQFQRVTVLAPENLAARLWLAHLFVEARLPDEALRIIKEIHAQAQTLGVSRSNQPELLQVELSAHLARNDVEQAQATLGKALERYPGTEELLMTAAEAYLKYGLFTNALSVLDREISLSPTNQNALLDKGYAYLQMNAYTKAIPPLTRALELETNNFAALLNRAIAYLRTDQLDAAEQDYNVLLMQSPKAYQVYFGLGEIAWRKKDTNAAIRNYQLYMTNAPANTDEAKQVSGRLKDLGAGSR
jgi:tetratricopeptide (TPR) repeat protein